MTPKEWKIIVRKTDEVIIQMQQFKLLWKIWKDKDADPFPYAHVTELEMIQIKPNDQTLHVSFTTKCHIYDKDKTSRVVETKCSTGYNQEDSTFDDVNETFFKKLKWEMK